MHAVYLHMGMKFHIDCMSVAHDIPADMHVSGIKQVLDYLHVYRQETSSEQCMFYTYI